MPGAKLRAVDLIRRQKVTIRIVLESPSRTSSQRITAVGSPFGSCGLGASATHPQKRVVDPRIECVLLCGIMLAR